MSHASDIKFWLADQSTYRAMNLYTSDGNPGRLRRLSRVDLEPYAKQHGRKVVTAVYDEKGRYEIQEPSVITESEDGTTAEDA